MTIHIYTCECGETFRDKNQLMARELLLQHQDAAPRHRDYSMTTSHHQNMTHTTIETMPVVPPEPMWRPSDEAK